MSFGTVLYESKERVATITLNRPERFNAISETMPEDIAKAFDHASVKAVHLYLQYELRNFSPVVMRNSNFPFEPMDRSFSNMPS